MFPLTPNPSPNPSPENTYYFGPKTPKSASKAPLEAPMVSQTCFVELPSPKIGGGFGGLKVPKPLSSGDNYW